jgi:hypothetical protein
VDEHLVEDHRNVVHTFIVASVLSGLDFVRVEVSTGGSFKVCA